jgi:hypothetical protein
MDSSLFGGICPGIDWTAQYTGGAGSGGSVFPEDDTPAWTKAEAGDVVASAVSCVLATDLEGTGGLTYTLAQDLAAGEGAYLEAFLQVSGDLSAPDSGLRLVLCTAEEAYAAWIHSGGLNIDGEANVALDMSNWRNVRLMGRGASCALAVDGVVVQLGPKTGVATASYVEFGIPTQTGVIGADWREIRSRRLSRYETFPVWVA